MPRNTRARISVNKLGEYVVATELANGVFCAIKYPKRISRECTMPKQQEPYRSASRRASVILRQSRKQSVSWNKNPGSAGAMRRISSNIDALESFDAMLDDIDLKGATAEMGEQKPKKLVIHGVDISVRPEIIMRGVGRGGKIKLVR